MRLRSRQEFIACMEHRHVSVRELARWVSCHPSMIGHLRSGMLSSCSTQLAVRIEKALGVVPGTLFELPVDSASASSVPSHTGRWL